MSDNVNSPTHYTAGSIECIDAIRAALTDEEFRGFCKGNVIKYVWRERIKGGDESLQKANWYMDKAVSVSSPPAPEYAYPETNHSKAQAADGWIEWAGGECPVESGARIDLRFHSGDEITGMDRNWIWKHEGLSRQYHIIAYRITKDTQ